MAKGSSSSQDKKNEYLELVVFIFLAVFALGLLTWLAASNKIVWSSLKPMLFFGAMWKWIPTDFTHSQWNEIVVTAIAFSQNPTDVSLISWVGFVNLAMLPLTLLISAVYLGVLILLFTRKGNVIYRVFMPVQLLEHTKFVFSGVAPVITIRKKIVSNKLPEWRIQVTPEEAFQGKYKGRPLVQSNEFQADVAREYFIGMSDKAINGRMITTMLGRQIVNLPVDAKQSAAICFPDRLSNEGKAVFALWSAVAFGGQEGKAEYTEYCRKLNMSAYGSPTGKANLTVIQDLYNKYRKNKQAANIFAMHHWEHTVLYAILEIAQRRGRYTTAEVLWLRPMNRVMFFSLNSCGSKTPHVEAASTFSQLAYERACHAHNRLPLLRTPDGVLMHHISVDRAVTGLHEDYEHWKVSIDEDDEWWSKKSLWKSRDRAMAAVLSEYADGTRGAIPQGPAGEQSQFDQVASAERVEAEANERKALSAALGGDLQF